MFDELEKGSELRGFEWVAVDRVSTASYSTANWGQHQCGHRLESYHQSVLAKVRQQSILYLPRSMALLDSS